MNGFIAKNPSKSGALCGMSDRPLERGVLVFREGIDLPSHPSSMLAYRQVVALHAIRIDGVADRRRPQGRRNLLSGPVDDARGDVDHPPMHALFDDHRIAQVGWRVAAGGGRPPPGP